MPSECILDISKSMKNRPEPSKQVNIMESITNHDVFLNGLFENGDRVVTSTAGTETVLADSTSDHHLNNETMQDELNKLLHADREPQMHGSHNKPSMGYDTTTSDLQNFLNAELNTEPVTALSTTISPTETVAGVTTSVENIPADLKTIKVESLLAATTICPANIVQHPVYQNVTTLQAPTPHPVPMQMVSESETISTQSFVSSPSGQVVNNGQVFTTNCFAVGGIQHLVADTVCELGTLVTSSEPSEKELIVEAGSTLPASTGEAAPHSMLRQILTGEREANSPSNSSVSSPEAPVESPSFVSSPSSVFHEASTQSTLIQQSEKLHLGSESIAVEDDMQSDFWTSVLHEPTMMDMPTKAHKSSRDSDAHSSMPFKAPPVEKLFDVGGAISTAGFVFTKFGTDVTSGLFTFGVSSSAQTISTSATDTRVVPSLINDTGVGQTSTKPVQVKSSNRKPKETNLTTHFPSRSGTYELRILSQPEDQHRARYLTEGSRGAVKDRSGQGFPVVKLLGYSGQVTLQIYVGNEAGRVKPHGFYQACKVCGKNSTPCSEKQIDGTVVIETTLLPENDMTVSIDCVGILKLRNADVEKRIGVVKAKAKKKNNTRARLVFRASFEKPDGAWQTLQIASTPILCTQPVGQPEISRMSLCESDVNGGDSLFIIGKNFLKGTEVIFQEVMLENGDVLWQQDAEIDTEYFQSTHLICTVPKYPNMNIIRPVQVQIVVNSGGKLSDPQEFVYKPSKFLIGGYSKSVAFIQTGLLPPLCCEC